MIPHAQDCISLIVVVSIELRILDIPEICLNIFSQLSSLHYIGHPGQVPDFRRTKSA